MQFIHENKNITVHIKVTEKLQSSTFAYRHLRPNMAENIADLGIYVFYITL